MSLKKAIESLSEAVTDLTSLHVQTYTGTVDFDITKSAGGLDNIRKEITAKSKATGTGNNKVDAKVKLVAEAYIQFDGDSYNFLTNELQMVPPAALQIHRDAIDAGIKTRQGLLNLFKDLLT